MKLILGLGNPGSKYTANRHNIGFMALDYYADKYNLPAFQLRAKFQAEISEFSHQGEKIILAKPTTFYNLSGQSARAIADFYHIIPENILVIHDELALDFGIIRTREKGSDAGNNGVKSLIAHLGPSFWRIRVGTKNALLQHASDPEFVLGRFSKEELDPLHGAVLPEISNRLLQFINNHITNTSKRLTASDAPKDRDR